MVKMILTEVMWIGELVEVVVELGSELTEEMSWRW
jgi:hypothetical protein